MSWTYLLIVAIAAEAGLGALMACAWSIQQTGGKSGWIDAFWTFGVGAISVVASLIPFREGHVLTWRQVGIAAMVGIWSLRLGVHIVERTWSGGDDPRYRSLVKRWQAAAPGRMFRFLQSQASAGVVLVIAVALAAHNPNPSFRLQDFTGIGILLIAVAGEAVADWQLRDFRSRSLDRRAVCEIGLWRYSRHPNYFFEWLAWLAYPTVAIDFSGQNPLGIVSLSAPALMYWTLVHVSGIPPLEEHMAQTRDHAFFAYQRRTSAFFPLPRCRGK